MQQMVEMAKHLSAVAALIAAALFVALAPPAQAQPNITPGAGRGTLQLPTGIEALASIDAHNFIMVQMRDNEDADKRHYAVTAPRHVYSGGIARLFGGSVITTEQFLVPDSAHAGNLMGANPAALGGNSGSPSGIFSVSSNNPFANRVPIGGSVTNSYNSGLRPLR